MGANFGHQAGIQTMFSVKKWLSGSGWLNCRRTKLSDITVIVNDLYKVNQFKADRELIQL